MTGIRSRGSIGRALSIGLAVGFGGGFLSLGGGTLAIPLLMTLIGLSAFQSRGTALMLALFSAGTGAWVYARAGHVDWSAVALIAIPSMIVTPLTARYTERFSNSGLKRFFGLVLMAGALALFIKDHIELQPLISQTGRELFLIAVGVVEGLVAGSVGVSGGPILAPALVLGLGMPQQLAQGCSLAARLPAVLTGLAENIRHRHVCWWCIPWLAVGSLPGAWIGGQLALWLPEPQLRQVFALLLVLLGLNYLLRPEDKSSSGSG